MFLSTYVLSGAKLQKQKRNSQTFLLKYPFFYIFSTKMKLQHTKTIQTDKPTNTYENCGTAQ